MAKYCIYCGAELRPGAKFCLRCGKAAGFEEPKTAPVSPERKRSTVHTAKQPKQRSILNRVLLIILAVELAAAGFRYPGFLIKKDKLAASGTPGNIQNSGSLNGISAVYTEEEIKSAETKEVSVSPEEPFGQCGDVSVNFESWNLDEEDTLIVKKLPEKQDLSSGFTVRAYDFSLASGNDQFITDVTITIPRTASDDDIAYCAAYNEENGEWEYVSHEISEDGQFYYMYTDHFCEKGEVILSGSEFSQVSSVNEKSAELMNLCYVKPKQYDRTGMDLPVFMNYSWLFQYLERECPITFDSVYSVMGSVPVSDYPSELPYPDLFGYTDAANNTASIIGKGGEVLGVLDKKGFLNTKIIGTDTVIGSAGSSIMSVLGIYAGWLKISNEALKGRSWWDAAMQNKLDTFGAGVSAFGLSFSTIAGLTELGYLSLPAATAAAPYVAIGCAAAGVGIFLYSKLHTDTSPRTLDPQEQIYHDYFKRDKVSRMFLFDVEYKDSYADLNIGVMRPLPSLKDAENEQLKNIINSSWDKKDQTKRGLTGFDPEIKKEDYMMDKGWANALKFLYRTCQKDRPERTFAVIREFYESYARAPFTNGSSVYLEYARKDIRYRNYDESLIEVMPDTEIRDDYIDLVIAKAYAAHTYFHESMMRTMRSEAEDGLVKIMEKQFMPMLNAPVEFTVTDKSLSDPKKLTESVYGIDYTEIPANKSLLNAGVYQNVLSPMQFAFKTDQGYEAVYKPMFRPWREYRFAGKDLYNPVPKDHYFPYTDSFLPRVKAGTNVIFRCTYYNYMLMGSPSAIIFTDVKDASAKPKPVEFTTVKYGSDGIIHVDTEITSPAKPDKVFTEYAEGVVNAGHSGVFGLSDWGTKAALKALRDIRVEVAKDGSFTGTSGASVPLDDAGGSGSDSYTMTGSIGASVSISGKVDPKTGKGNCTVTASGSHNETLREISVRGNKEKDIQFTYDTLTEKNITYSANASGTAEVYTENGKQYMRLRISTAVRSKGGEKVTVNESYEADLTNTKGSRPPRITDNTGNTSEITVEGFITLIQQ